MLDENSALSIYHSENHTDTTGVLYQQPAFEGIALSSTRYEVDLEEGRHGFIMSLGGTWG